MKKVTPRWGGPFTIQAILPPGDSYHVQPWNQPDHPLVVIHGARMKRFYSREAGLGLGAPYKLSVEGDLLEDEQMRDEIEDELTTHTSPHSTDRRAGDEDHIVEADAPDSSDSIPLSLPATDSLQGLGRLWSLSDLGDGE